MSDTNDLTVRVLDDRDIVVAGAEFEVTYRKDGHLPMLIATDALREQMTASKVRFLAEAWKARGRSAGSRTNPQLFFSRHAAIPPPLSTVDKRQKKDRPPSCLDSGEE